MGYPPSTVVVRPGGFLSVHAQTIDKVEQGEVTLRQVTYLGKPVIHLSIDVHCPIAAPGRADLVVPNALQVCRLRSQTRTGYQQITTILKVQRDELLVLCAFPHRLQPLISRYPGIIVTT